jgi:hypothetical protein
MEDSAPVHARPANLTGEFVVRQFLPARIERLLLTRLFDLTTTSVVGDERSLSFDLLPSASSAGSRSGVRGEAA